jgi:hypothetical protein
VSGTPVLEPATYPSIRHTGAGTWATLCEQCGAELNGSHVGGVISEHAVHITREHNTSPPETMLQPTAFDDSPSDPLTATWLTRAIEED